MFEIPGSDDRSDRILTHTRWAAAALVVPLTAAFVILYLLPNDTDRYFAWGIQPPLTSLIVGAGYLSGAYFFGRLFLGKKWHHFGIPFLSVTTFATTMAIATVIHWDRFNHGHVAFWVWVFLYIVTPPLVPALWAINRRTDPGAGDPGYTLVPRIARIAVGVAGVIWLAIAAVLFLWPSLAIDHWPWQISPLTSRVLGGWYAFGGVAGLMLATDSRWSAWRIPLQGSLLWTVLMLVGVLRYWNDLEWSRALTPVFVTSLVAGTLLFILVYVLLEFRLRERDTLLAETSAGVND